MMNLTKKTKYYIVAVLSALFLLIGGIFFTKYNSPIEKFKRKLETSNYVSAVEIYNTNLAFSDDKLKAAAFMMNELNVILQEFQEGIRDYNAVTAELDAFSQIGDITAYVADIRNEVDTCQRSHEAYALAEDYYLKEDFENAIIWYRQVTLEDGSFQDAQRKLEASISSYRDAVLQKVDELAAKENYAEANTVLSEAFSLLPTDATLSQKWDDVLINQEAYLRTQDLEEINSLLAENNYEGALRLAKETLENYIGDAQIEAKYEEAANAYEQNITAQIENLLREKNLEGAMGKVNELSVLLPGSDAFYTLSDRVMRYYPIKLSDLKITEKKDLEYSVESNPRDFRGNAYDWGIVYEKNGASGAHYVWEIHLLNKDYKKFTATLVPSEKMGTNAHSESECRIYTSSGAGEVEIFSTAVNMYSDPINISIDVTGADTLKIEFAFGYFAKYLLANPELVAETLD